MTDKKYFIRSCFFLLLIIVLFFGGSGLCDLKVIASEKTETERSEEEIMEGIRGQRSGVVRIESICWDGDSTVYQTKAFSGFVVSEGENGIYVATVHDHLTYTSEEKEAIRKEQKLEDNVNLSEKIEVVFDGDLRVPVSIVGESDQRNLTVLRLNQQIHFGSVLQFVQENTFHRGQVFLLSYPGSVDTESGIYNEDSVMVKKGTVLESSQEGDVTFLEHDIEADSSSAGGPLLNQDGAVVGLLLTSKGEKAGTAISGESLKAFLNTYNVSYQEYEEIIEEKKLPIVNLILAGLIILLLLLVASQFIKGRASKGKEGGKSFQKKAAREKTEVMTNRTAENRKHQNAKNPTRPGEAVYASLEYPKEKRIAFISKGTFVIGRGEDVDFVLSSSKEISRRHACIRFDGKEFYLTDMKSTNRTFLNGLELIAEEKHRLKDGDEITVGKQKLIFHRKNEE